jgi:hypothetical protein
VVDRQTNDLFPSVLTLFMKYSKKEEKSVLAHGCTIRERTS